MTSEIMRMQCLLRRDASTSLRVQALQQTSDAFLATHTPMHNLRVRRGRLAEPSDEGLYDAIRAVPQDQSALFVVRGAKGSGKSHLIRWLKHRLVEAEGLRPVFLERSDSSLRGMLDRLVAEFGDAFEADDLASLRSASEQLTEVGLSHKLLDNLALQLDPDATKSWAGPIEHRGTARRLRLADLFRHGRVRAVLTSEQEGRFGYVTKLLHKLNAGAGPRQTDGDPADEVLFGLDDWKRIRAIPSAELGNHLSEPLSELAASEELRRTLLAIVNTCVKPALQQTLGIARDELPRLFAAFRERLHGQHRLLMLIEDVSVFQGVDDQLLEALIPDDFDRTVSGRAPRAPIVSVVGVTNDYYEEFIASRGAYRERITHEVQLTIGRDEGDGSVRPFEAEADGFTARYLNLLRHSPGDESLARWAKAHGGPPPSPCTKCIHRQACHEAFGSFKPADDSEPIGLFPFSQRAIENITRALYDTESGAHEPTPRKLLAFLTNAVSLLADAEHHGFPTAEVASDALLNPTHARRLPAGLRARLRHVENAELLVTLLTWWGDGDASIRSAEFGRTAFGVPEGIFEALGLDFPSQLLEPARDEPSIPQRPTTPGQQQAQAPRSSTAPEQTSGDTPSHTTGQLPSHPPNDSDNPKISPIELDVEKWGDGGDLPGASDIAKQLLTAAHHGLVWEHGGIPHGFGDEIIKGRHQLIAFEGVERGARSGTPAVTIPRVRWHEVLALLQIERGETHSATCHDAVSIASWIRDRLIDYVRETMPRLSDGRIWSPGAAALRLLFLDLATGNPALAGAYAGDWVWLLEELLNQKPNRSRSDLFRTPAWSDLRALFTKPGEGGADRRGELIEVAKNWYQLTQGGSGASACFDAPVAITVLEPLRFVPIWEAESPEVPERVPRPIALLPIFERAVIEAFRRAMNAERDRAGDLAMRLEDTLAGDEVCSVVEQVERLDKAVHAVGPLQCSDLRGSCRQAIERLRAERPEVLALGWAAKAAADLRSVAEAETAAKFISSADDAPWADCDLVLKLVASARQLQIQASAVAQSAEAELPDGVETLVEAAREASVALVDLARSCAMASEEDHA